jgi:hypothetical protein
VDKAVQVAMAALLHLEMLVLVHAVSATTTSGLLTCWPAVFKEQYRERWLAGSWGQSCAILFLGLCGSQPGAVVLGPHCVRCPCWAWHIPA